jgi:hypothetical protein
MIIYRATGSNSMSGKYNHYRVYFVNQPTTYYSSSAVSENAAIRQAIGAAKGLGRRGPFPVARVVNIDLPENADPRPTGWSEGRNIKTGDGSRVFHLMITELRGAFLVSRAACSAHRHTFGLVESEPSGNKCRACAKIAAKVAAGAQIAKFKMSVSK